MSFVMPTSPLQTPQKHVYLSPGPTSESLSRAVEQLSVSPTRSVLRKAATPKRIPQRSVRFAATVFEPVQCIKSHSSKGELSAEALEQKLKKDRRSVRYMSDDLDVFDTDSDTTEPQSRVSHCAPVRMRPVARSRQLRKVSMRRGLRSFERLSDAERLAKLNAHQTVGHTPALCRKRRRLMSSAPCTQVASGSVSQRVSTASSFADARKCPRATNRARMFLHAARAQALGAENDDDCDSKSEELPSEQCQTGGGEDFAESAAEVMICKATSMFNGWSLTEDSASGSESLRRLSIDCCVLQVSAVFNPSADLVTRGTSTHGDTDPFRVERGVQTQTRDCGIPFEMHLATSSPLPVASDSDSDCGQFMVRHSDVASANRMPVDLICDERKTESPPLHALSIAALSSSRKTPSRLRSANVQISPLVLDSPGFGGGNLRRRLKKRKLSEMENSSPLLHSTTVATDSGQAHASRLPKRGECIRTLDGELAIVIANVEQFAIGSEKVEVMWLTAAEKRTAVCTRLSGDCVAAIEDMHTMQDALIQFAEEPEWECLRKRCPNVYHKNDFCRDLTIH